MGKSRKITVLPTFPGVVGDFHWQAAGVRNRGEVRRRLGSSQPTSPTRELS